jgi:hypothetical protein
VQLPHHLGAADPVRGGSLLQPGAGRRLPGLGEGPQHPLMHRPQPAPDRGEAATTGPARRPGESGGYRVAGGVPERLTQRRNRRGAAGRAALIAVEATGDAGRRARRSERVGPVDQQSG